MKVFSNLKKSKLYYGFILDSIGSQCYYYTYYSTSNIMIIVLNYCIYLNHCVLIWIVTMKVLLLSSVF